MQENWEVGENPTLPRNGEGEANKTTGRDLGRFVCVVCVIAPSPKPALVKCNL